MAAARVRLPDPPANVVVGTADALPVPDASVDVVLSGLVLLRSGGNDPTIRNTLRI